MKISVVGEYYSSNLGDPIIVDSLKYIIKKIDKRIEVNVVDLSARNTRVSSKSNQNIKRISICKNLKSDLLTNVRSIRNITKWLYRDMKKIDLYFSQQFKDSNLIIIAGGQLIMNNNFIFPLRLHSVIKYARKNNVPVYFNACGVQRYNKKTLGVILLQKILNDKIVKKITTRDDIEMLKKYVTLHDKINVAIDSAIMCDAAYNIKKDQDSNILGLGVISADMYKRYYDRTKDDSYLVTEEELLLFWRNLINEINSKKIPWRIFTNGDAIDYDFANKLIRSIGLDNRISDYIEKEPEEPEELLKTISQYSAIISHRLHSHIVAFSLGIPSIGLIWDKKTLDFGKQVNRKELFFNIKTTSVEEIIKKLEKDGPLYQNFESQDYKQQAIEQIQEIIESYNRLGS